MPTTSYRYPLSHEAELVVWFLTERDEVTSYAVVLVRDQDHLDPVRVYDNAHGQNELHRHTRTGGKQAAEPHLQVSHGEAMRAAIGEILAGYDKMIEAWRR